MNNPATIYQYHKGQQHNPHMMMSRNLNNDDRSILKYVCVYMSISLFVCKVDNLSYIRIHG